MIWPRKAAASACELTLSLCLLSVVHRGPSSHRMRAEDVDDDEDEDDYGSEEEEYEELVRRRLDGGRFVRSFEKLTTGALDGPAGD